MNALCMLADFLEGRNFIVTCAIVAAFTVSVIVGTEGQRAECAVCVHAN